MRNAKNKFFSLTKKKNREWCPAMLEVTTHRLPTLNCLFAAQTGSTASSDDIDKATTASQTATKRTRMHRRAVEDILKNVRLS